MSYVIKLGEMRFVSEYTSRGKALVAFSPHQAKTFDTAREATLYLADLRLVEDLLEATVEKI